jgi:hypothetical protein
MTQARILAPEFDEYVSILRTLLVQFLNDCVGHGDRPESGSIRSLANATGHL